MAVCLVWLTVPVLVCGTFAYDTILVFHGRFAEHILPGKAHQLNVSFRAPELRREFGGGAGNMAYTLKQLGVDVLPFGTVGEDFGPYAEWLDQNGIDRRYIVTIPGTYTAQAFITTDLDDNQICAFHPGALDHAHLVHVPRDAGITLGVVSLEGRDGMKLHAQEFADAGIPFLFDPGQHTPLFNGEELLQFIGQAEWIAVNDYEAAIIEQRTGLGAEQIAEQVSAYIVTRGAQGAYIYAGGMRYEIPAVKVENPVDPTGCGDAFRAGVIYGLTTGFSLQEAGEFGAELAAAALQFSGGQGPGV